MFRYRKTSSAGRISSSGALRDAADPPERVGNLVVLRRGLRFVREILEATAAADREVPARCVDAQRTRRQHLGGKRLGVPALHLGDAGAHRVSRQAAPHEHDESVQARDTVPAVGEPVNGELELLVLRDGCGHEGPGYAS